MNDKCKREINENNSHLGKLKFINEIIIQLYKIYQ